MVGHYRRAVEKLASKVFILISFETLRRKNPELVYPPADMTTDLKPCKGCHKQKLPCNFDLKKDGSLKLTCRPCLLTAKSRFQSKATLAIHRDIKKIRMDIMTEIHLSEDPEILTRILTTARSAINRTFPNLTSAAGSRPNDKNDITTSTSTLNCETAPSPFQTLDPLQ